MSKIEWYLEYEIHKNRPGVLGGISSLMGILSINILTINGVEHNRRGMLLQADNYEKIEMLTQLLKQMDQIAITALRAPKLADRLAIRHGRYIERYDGDRRIYRFTREEIGILVDLMGQIFKKPGAQLIGVRGMPRVGKTESIVASSVCANKRWLMISSTLLKQTVRSQILHHEISEDQIYIIDGLVSTRSPSDEHRFLVQEIMALNATKVIEHPDAFVRMTDISLSDFDYIIELRNDPNEPIIYEEEQIGFE